VTAPPDAITANTNTTLTHTVSGYGGVTTAADVRVDVVDTG